MYAKLVNGQLQKAGKFVLAGGNVYVNPTDTTLSELGYKTVVETEQPEEREGHYLVSGWRETKKQIKQTWDYVLIEPDDEELVPGGGEPL